VASPLHFTLPLPPNMANGRGHWRTRERERKDYYLRCCAAAGNPRPPRVPWLRATYTVHLFLYNPMDDDNALARCKHALDFLVRRGYIVDDARQHLRLASVPEQSIDRAQPRLLLTLTPG
jgi:hypothetical protein